MKMPKTILFIILYSLFTIDCFSQTNTLDQLEYNYNPGTNQLRNITDAISSTSSTIDLDNQNSTNYDYDALGQLTKDEAEGILTIEWSISAKVKHVSIDDNNDRVEDRTLDFLYDALGNRIKKTQTFITTASPQLITYYVRNATGALIALYEDDGSGVERKEIPLSIGTDKTQISITASLTNDSTSTRNVGNKYYELKDHLGSVRTVITDIKNSTLDASNSPKTFSADIASTTDYYSYGMQMPGRTYQNSNYRYAFQGKEKDNDLKGDGNSYDFCARLYDSRMGRWLSVDPLADKFPGLSPYNFCNNSPSNFEDPDGKAPSLSSALDQASNYLLNNTKANWNESLRLAANPTGGSWYNSNTLQAGDAALRAGINGVAYFLMPTSDDIADAVLMATVDPMIGLAEGTGTYVANRVKKIAGKTTIKKLETVAKKVGESASDKTRTVLGKYMNPDGTPGTKKFIDEPGSSMGPNPGGTNVLSMPQHVWDDVGPQRFWDEYNKPWLDEAIDRGDEINLVSDPNGANLWNADESLSGFGQEFMHSAERGLDFDPVTNQLVKAKTGK